MALQLVNDLFAISCRPLSVRMNLAKQGVAVRMNRRAPLLDLDSSSRSPFKTRKDLKQTRFSKNDRPKRFAGRGNSGWSGLSKRFVAICDESNATERQAF